MNFIEFENSCAQYLNGRYSDTGCEFIVNGGMNSTAPDIVVKKNDKVICNIEVKEPNAQCGQFVAFANEETRSFIYSSRNHPSEPSKASLAILEAMSKDFERHRIPSANELGLDKQLYYERIVDYYANYKQCKFFMTRESVGTGSFIIFPTVCFKEYFDVTACYRPKNSGSHNPNVKEKAVLPEILIRNGFENHLLVRDGKYLNVQLDIDAGKCFIIEDQCRIQFRRIQPMLYRITTLLVG